MDLEEDFVCRESLAPESAPTSSVLSDECSLDDTTDWTFEPHFDAESPRVIDRLLGMEEKSPKTPLASEPTSPPTPGFMSIANRYQWVHWAIEAADFLELHSETIYLAVHYMDRLLSTSLVPFHMAELFAVVCLRLASKMNDDASPPVDEFLSVITDHHVTEAMLSAAEITILKRLEFRLSNVTPHSIIFRMSSIISDLEARKMVIRNAQLFLDVALLDLRGAASAPSILAASAFLCGMEELEEIDDSAWIQYLGDQYAIQEDAVRKCRSFLMELLSDTDAPRVDTPTSIAMVDF